MSTKSVANYIIGLIISKFKWLISFLMQAVNLCFSLSLVLLCGNWGTFCRYVGEAAATGIWDSCPTVTVLLKSFTYHRNVTSLVCVIVGMTLVAPPYFHILSLIIFLGCIIFLSPFVDVIEALKQLVYFLF